MISIDWGSATDTSSGRERNEDSLFAQSPVFLVADGMGGQAAGEVASRLAVAAFAQLTAAPTTRLPAVLEAVSRANQSIVDAARADASRHGMGTTLVGLALVEDLAETYWLVFNIGDSRLYRWSAGALEQLTVDHSGTEDQTLTRFLGTEPAPTADCWLLCPVPGERFLLCSDGLTGPLDEERIKAALAESAPAAALAHRLVAEAVRAGASDNVTAVVVNVSGEQG